MLRRNGMTLMEVLVAIFVTAIGLLSILAMFPMGSLTMERSIQDDRVSHGLGNARAIAAAMNVRFDSTLQSYFLNPNPANPNQFLAAPLDGPSYPVYVDPVGNLSYTASYVGWIAGAGSTNIVRRPAPAWFIPSTTMMLTYGVLLDDITFGPNAQPLKSSGSVERADTISWAWMLQRPKAGDPSCCNMAIVVYSQRPLSTGVRLAGKEVAYPNATSNATQPNLVTLTWAAGKPSPQVKQGSWVLDATIPTAVDPTTKGLIIPMATFFRVSSVKDPVGNTVQIELDQPLQGSILSRTIVVLDGVVDVFNCGPGWQSWNK